MNVLEMYEQKLKQRECIMCSHHVTRPGIAQDIHFCEVSGKILLFPLYLPQDCTNFEGRCEVNDGK